MPAGFLLSEVDSFWESRHYQKVQKVVLEITAKDESLEITTQIMV